MKAVEPCFRIIVGDILNVGTSGGVETDKAANQTGVSPTIEAGSECLPSAPRAGADVKGERQASTRVFAQSRILELLRQRMLERNSARGFRIRYRQKDLNNALIGQKGPVPAA